VEVVVDVALVIIAVQAHLLQAHLR
jgi:hypothetical protein